MAAKRVFKTKKKLAGGNYEFRKWGDWKEGDFVIGKFVGWHTDQYEKECPLIVVEDAEFQGKPKLAASMVGKTLCLNAAGKMNKAIIKGIEDGQIEENDTLIQLSYNGMSTMEKGKYAGKDAHDISVDIVEEDGDESEDESEEEDEDVDL